MPSLNNVILIEGTKKVQYGQQVLHFQDFREISTSIHSKELATRQNSIVPDAISNISFTSATTG
jgi:hypothetical protein